jgi:hypothetical protein|eukprot:COSAG02_NODE_1676_length_11364_cov_12.500755_11_plen_91_part_00
MGLESHIVVQSVNLHGSVVKDIKLLLVAQLERSRDTLKRIVKDSVRNAFFVGGELEISASSKRRPYRHTAQRTRMSALHSIDTCSREIAG